MRQDQLCDLLVAYLFDAQCLKGSVSLASMTLATCLREHGLEISSTRAIATDCRAECMLDAQRPQRVTTHPGEMLREEFLGPLGISQNDLAMRIHVPATRIGEIIHGRRAITSDTALRLARFFGNSAEFWMNLQVQYDLSKARIELEKSQMGRIAAADHDCPA